MNAEDTPVTTSVPQTGKKHSLVLTRSELLEALKTEISRLEADDKKPGWTLWALSGTLAAILWTLLRESEAGGYEWKLMLESFVFVSLACDFLSELPALMRIGNAPYLQQGRFWTTGILSGVRIAIFTRFVRYTVLAASAFECGMHGLGGKVIVISFALGAVSCIVGFVISYRKYPIGNFGTLKSAAISGAESLLTICCLAIAAAEILRWQTGTFRSFRVGLLAAVGFMVLVKLTDEATPNPILEILQSIQRDLLFGRSSLDDALMQTDLAIGGLRLNDVLQGELRPVLQAVNGLQSGLKEGFAHIETIRKLLQDQPEKDWSEDALRILNSLVVCAEAQIKSCSLLSEQLAKHQKKLAEKSRLIRFCDPSTVAELNNTVSQIATAAKEHKAQLALLQNQLAAEKRRFEQLLSNRNGKRGTEPI